MIKEGDIPVLNQLIKTLEDFYVKLNKSYEKKDSENFNKIKGELIRIQKEILNITNS